MIFFLHDKTNDLYYINQSKSAKSMGIKIKTMRRDAPHTLEIVCVVSEAQYSKSSICKAFWETSSFPKQKWHQDKDKKIQNFISNNRPLYIDWDKMTREEITDPSAQGFMATFSSERRKKHKNNIWESLSSILDVLSIVASPEAIFCVYYGQIIDPGHPNFGQNAFLFWSKDFTRDENQSLAYYEGWDIPCYAIMPLEKWDKDTVAKIDTGELPDYLFPQGISFSTFREEVSELSLPYFCTIKGKTIEIDWEVSNGAERFLSPKYYVIPCIAPCWSFRDEKCYSDFVETI